MKLNAGQNSEPGESPDESASDESKPLADAELDQATGGAHSPTGEDSRGLWQINVELHAPPEGANALTSPAAPLRKT